MGIQESTKKKQKQGPVMSNIEKIEMKENQAVRDKYGVEDQK